METKVKVRTCEHCVFSYSYQDMGASMLCCSLHRDLSLSVKAVKNVATCKHKITLDEVKEIAKEKYGPIPDFN